MIIGVSAAQGGGFKRAQFKQISAAASPSFNTKKLGVRFGAKGEEAGDLAVIAVTHRSNLTPPDGLTLLSHQRITDATGIVQSLSLFYIKLATGDLGRPLDFTQVLEKRMSLAYTVQRPGNITSALTVVAFAEQAETDTPAPWSAAPVTGTHYGQLVVQAQARVAATDTDMYLVPNYMVQAGDPKGSRLTLGSRTINDNLTQAGEFTLDNPGYDVTSTLSASVIFSVQVYGPPQNITLSSQGNGSTSDLTQAGRFWRVRPDAGATLWHKVKGSPTKIPKAGLFFEMKIEEGPVAGGPRVWGFGFCRDRMPSTSVTDGPDNVDCFMWMNDGTVVDKAGAFPWPYVPKTVPWGVGDTVGMMLGEWSYGENPLTRLYINGEFAGEFRTSGFTSEQHQPIVMKLGPDGAIRSPDRVIRLPDGCTVWN